MAPEGMPHCHFQVVVYHPLIVKLDLLLGGMHVDIDPGRVYFEKDDVKRVRIGWQESFIGLHHGVVQVAALDETLVDKEMESGYHEVNFDASKLSSGVYLYQLQAGEYVSVKKMLLLK